MDFRPMRRIREAILTDIPAIMPVIYAAREMMHRFTYCGIIYLLSGDERLAYQKTIKDTLL